MSESYVGEIRAFGFNFNPMGWAQCNGQLLSISSNAALFSILGTTYGGNGTTNFGLPNLQGQIPMHWGAAAGGGQPTVLGQPQGTPNVTLTTQQLPSHTHTATGAQAAQASQRTAAPNANATSFLAQSEPPNHAWQSSPTTPNTQFAPNAISIAGTSLPHDNMQPYLTLNFCISLFGQFPSRG